MAKSKYEYVKLFEHDNHLLPQTYIVVRVDGRGFHQLSKQYNFVKPNDLRAIELMNSAATAVFRNVSDIIFGYGDSDEYSFVFDKSTTLFERREAKLVSTVVSTFTAHYLMNWYSKFPDTPLLSSNLPTFDGRCVVYPSSRILRDYLSWRQVDCHINNLYNTTFWALVEKGGLTPTAAEERLRGTVSSDKNEILFSEFKINYNQEPEIFKKGSIMVWKQLRPIEDGELSERQLERLSKKRAKAEIQVLHVDIIRDGFWEEYKLLD